MWNCSIVHARPERCVMKKAKHEAAAPRRPAKRERRKATLFSRDTTGRMVWNAKRSKRKMLSQTRHGAHLPQARPLLSPAAYDNPSCAFSSLPHRRRRGCARFRPLREAPCSSALPQLSCAAHKKSGDSDVSPLSKTACRTARYGVAFMSCTMELSVLVSWARSLTA